MATEPSTRDQKSGTHTGRLLEARRGRPAESTRAGIEKPSGFAPPESRQPTIRSAQVPAIYLIEREAIRLRRLRWQEIESTPCSVAAKSADAKHARGPQAPRLAEVTRGTSESLKYYARPAVSPDTLLDRRMGNRVRAFFRRDPKEKS